MLKQIFKICLSSEIRFVHFHTRQNVQSLPEYLFNVFGILDKPTLDMNTFQKVGGSFSKRPPFHKAGHLLQYMNQDALMQASASWLIMQARRDGLLATVTLVRRTIISVLRLICRICLNTELRFGHSHTQANFQNLHRYTFHVLPS